MSTIAVVGTGMMGPGIAAILALAGHEVTLFGRSDLSAQRGVAAAADAMDLLCREGLATRQHRSEIRASTELGEAVAEADFVFESIVEDLAEKQQLFNTLEQLASPSAIFTSNTSGL